MIKNFALKFKQIKYRLLVYFGVLLMLSFGMVMLINYEAGRIVDSYRKFAVEFQLLSEFYREVEAAASHAQVYLLIRSEEERERYTETFQNAERLLVQLSEIAESEEVRREYQVLKNMLRTYDDVFNQMLEEGLDASEPGLFSRYPRSIQFTYIHYVEMLTGQMIEERQLIEARMRRQTRLTWVAVLVMFLGAIGGMLALTNSIANPLKKMVENVEKIKRGNYRIEEVECSDAQLQVLATAIIELAESIENNRDHVEERMTLEKILTTQEIENLKTNQLLMETKLRVLQGQMNPHFLFNTLNLISKMAYIEQAPRTSLLMEKTASILRYSLEKSTSTSSLCGEIESVKNYIEIQRARMGHRIYFQLNIEEGLPDVIMQGMIIQPIIENALIHGVNDMVDGAEVTLSIGLDGEYIQIVVEDNGKGINSDIMEQIFSEQEEYLESGEEVTKSKIGIHNVRQRLEMFYGRNDLLNIESSENCGTIVTIKIPIT